MVHTVLGSCVSVCLWDRRLACGGMNHFMLPLWNGEGLATPKYGNIAIENLLEQMLFMGCRKEDLVAKVFGGANVMRGDPDFFNVGERNIIVAREHLGRHRIPVVGMEVGGNIGFKVIFNTQNGIVRVGREQCPNTPADLPFLMNTPAPKAQFLRVIVSRDHSKTNASRTGLP